MHKTIRQIIKATPNVFVQSLPVWLLERIVRIDKISLLYHVISPELGPHIKHLYPHKSPNAFELDIEYLKQTYPPLPVEELAGLGNHLGGFRRPAFIISFDDGLRECFDFVSPILRKHQVKAAFFVCPGFVDNKSLFYRHKVSLCIEALSHAAPAGRKNMLELLGQACGQRFINENDFIVWIKGRSFSDEKIVDMTCELCGVDVAAFLKERRPYMTREQIKALAEDGHVIGAHSVHHPKLGELTEINQIEAEIVDSCKFVAGITHADRVPFAFPFSGVNLDSDLLKSIREKHPIVGQFFDSRGLYQDESYIQNRLGVDMPSSIKGVSNIPFEIEQALRSESSRRLRSQFRRMSWIVPKLGRAAA